MDTGKTSYQHIKTSEPYEAIGGSGILDYLSIITDECTRAIGDTFFIEYVGTAETSNVNIKTVDPDIAIKKQIVTSYDIFVDIVFGKVGRAMWWSADHHIERGCEHPPLIPPCIRDIGCWLKLHPPKERRRGISSVPFSHPGRQSSRASTDDNDYHRQ